MWFKWNSVLNYRSASIVVIGVAFFVATILVHADQQHSLSFGIDPYLPKSKLINKFLPLDHYRSEALEVPLNIEIVRDNEALIERLGRDRLDIAYMTPASYVEMTRRYGKHRLLARISVNGSPTYRGVIVIRADSPFKELSQLIHKRFAFGRVSSTISYRVRSEEHTSELQSHSFISYAVFCLKKKNHLFSFFLFRFLGQALHFEQGLVDIVF